eukprot:GGOE01002246.1.p1 GENE.GGOE01002246.1~~GGOE01002246.1.p1  ORF type:complete len:439 (+),score=168.67 GGOE01002246.1:29-1318(+)
MAAPIAKRQRVDPGSPLQTNPTSETSYPRNKIKILLLENVAPSGIERLRAEGFNVEALPKALSEEELLERAETLHVLGIRSKTKVTAAVLKKAKRLLAVACFCIGTDQVDLQAAQEQGIPVFNAPFANTRSVAELMVGEIICLARQLVDKSREIHAGTWNKMAVGCCEVRGKTLGLIGYGHIGSQGSVLAEQLGMKVIYYDVVPKLPLGNAVQVKSMELLLAESDFVSLHVPNLPSTVGLIGAEQIAQMKKGAYLLNASRGKVVDLDALATALKSGHLAGAAVDVFPWEPEKNGPGFETPLQGCPNTIMTPHIGGSTLEAQSKIGDEVAASIIKVINVGSTTGAVNFPEVDLPQNPNCHRILNIHRNVPGVLRNINDIILKFGANVEGQMLVTKGNIGYMVMDLDKENSNELRQAVANLDSSIRTRILY